MSLISVIIPVYNAEATIEKCLKSVIDNGYGNIEIICVDDGSSDNSLQIIKTYSEKDDRVKIISQLNAGVSAARNAGISASVGKYIAFVDSDDYVSEGIYSLLLQSITSSNSDQACCGAIRVTKDGQHMENHIFENESIHGEDEIRKKIIVPLTIPEDRRHTLISQVWNKLYKADIIKNNNIRFDTEVSSAEDWKFNIAYYSFCKAVSFIKDNLYYYCDINQNSLSKTVNGNDFENSMKNQDFIRRTVPYVFATDEDMYKRTLFIQEKAMRKYTLFNGGSGLYSYCKRIYSNKDMVSACEMLHNKNHAYMTLAQLVVKKSGFGLALYYLLSVWKNKRNILSYYRRKMLHR